MVATKDFYEALGYLMYALAAADTEGVEVQELKRIGRSMLNAFGSDMETKGNRAIARFEILADNKADPAEAYLHCIQLLEGCKPEVRQYQSKIIEVLEDIAAADSEYTSVENSYIERFKEDTQAFIG